MNDRELMQQALEALNHVNVQDRVQIITALRERLAQPRQWVGLTDAEVDDLQSGLSASHSDVRAIEAKLREKNA